MAEQRTPRKSDTREASKRPDDAWVPPSNLPEPEPRDGWVHRWIRVSMLNRSDNTNVSRRFREGWEPVKAEEYPEITAVTDFESRFPENIEYGGLLLCRAPAEKMEQRRAYQRNLAQKQMESVDQNFMREQDSRMPLHVDKKTRNEFGRG